MILADLQHLARPITDLKPLPGNPRRGDVEAVMRSYDQFGQRKPIVARPDGTVIAGNHQLEAAKRLGWSEIAVVTVDDDDLTAKAYALADNRTADLGTYDDDALRELLADVATDPDLLLSTGYSEADVDALMADLTTDLGIASPEPHIPDSAPAKTIRGDIWQLGSHRLMCGDCREPSDVDTLLNGAQINLAFTSPPYAEQREYDKTSGFKPIPPDDYVEWFQMVQANVAAHLSDDGSWFVNIKEHAQDGQRVLYVKDLTITHVREWSWRFVDEFCWNRGGVPGKWNNRFKNAWEPIFHFTRSKNIKFNPEANATETDSTFSYSPLNGKSGTGSGLVGEKHSGYQSGLALPSNLLTLKNGGNTAEGSHSASFPVGLPEWFIKAYTDEHDIVYDPFMGSGSTLLAAHNQNRTAYGMEISPAYCDIICKRFQQATGITPVAASTGQPHSFID